MFLGLSLNYFDCFVNLGGLRGVVTLPHILRFATGAEEEPVLGFSIQPSLLFIEAEGSFLPSANTCINCLKLPRATVDKPLPSEEHLFNLYDFAFANAYFGHK